VTLVLCSLYKIGGTTNKGIIGCGSNDSKGFATFATGRVVDEITEILVNGERLSRNGRLVSGNERYSAIVANWHSA
jgi:hypothetical protein